MRGTLTAGDIVNVYAGIIPAYAGNTDRRQQQGEA